MFAFVSGIRWRKEGKAGSDWDVGKKSHLAWCKHECTSMEITTNAANAIAKTVAIAGKGWTNFMS